MDERARGHKGLAVQMKEVTMEQEFRQALVRDCKVVDISLELTWRQDEVVAVTLTFEDGTRVEIAATADFCESCNEDAQAALDVFTFTK